MLQFWCWLFGIPFERAIKYHRWIARVAFISMTLHLALWWRDWTDQGTWTDHAIHFKPLVCSALSCSLSLNLLPACLQSLGDSSAKLWTGELSYLIFVVMATFAYETFRRKAFEVFYYVSCIISCLLGV